MIIIFLLGCYCVSLIAILMAWHATKELDLTLEEVFLLGGKNDELEARIKAMEEKDALFHASRMVASQSAEKPQGTPG